MKIMRTQYKSKVSRLVFFGAALLVIMIVITSCKTNEGDRSRFVNRALTTKESCEMKEDNVWYKDVCWKFANELENSALTAEGIPMFLEEYNKAKEQAFVMLDDVKYPIEDIGAQESDGIIFINFYKETEIYTFLFELPHSKLNKIFKGKKTTAPGLLTLGNPFTKDFVFDNPSVGEFKWNVFDEEQEEGTISFEGHTNEGIEVYAILNAMKINGGGVSTLEIKEDKAYLTGLLGTNTYIQMQALENHPEVTTLVLMDVPGSINDSINMHTGRLIRSLGLKTFVPYNSEVSSGGVDLFAAGTERIIERGGKLGIHSWCCFAGVDAGELPTDHPAHQFQVAYFTEMMGEEDGPRMYFRTLEAAPAEDIHFMTEKEMIKYNITTQIIDK